MSKFHYILINLAIALSSLIVVHTGHGPLQLRATWFVPRLLLSSFGQPTCINRKRILSIDIFF